MSYTYKHLVDKAKRIKTGVEKEYKLVEGTRWSYYFAKAIVTPKKTIKSITFNVAPKPSGDHISRQYSKAQYLKIANYLIKFVEKKKRLPNYIKYGSKKMSVNDYTYMLARVLVWYDKNGKLPTQANVNSKAFIKPVESFMVVYNTFVEVFGSISCIDDALDKIANRGYAYYYDDTYSNIESINRIKKGWGVNCTDSCQVFYNLCQYFIAKGKYKKVECLHIKCKGGDGHVRLRITLPNGEKFYRDPACTLESGGYCNWCSDGTLLAVDPNWFMENVNR